ncbi:O-acetylhomoserine aminocarboxypropyltransferase/cysteine synthase family protein [Pseudoscardovia radai]|uniref:O-acetylhomoserine aminocarboxypropyltransferase/cysteine synthase family protein n=1 Tax=Pseudoscardovia radai TaxID=987066 RepID=UPI0039911EA5
MSTETIVDTIAAQPASSAAASNTITAAEEARRSFATRALRAGYDPAEHANASSVPIYATAAYQLRDEEHATQIASFELADNIYTRISNPTTNVLEQRLAALHGVEGAVATASGLAAVTYSLLNAALGGGRILTTYRLYGGTVATFSDVLPDYGIGVDIVPNPDDPESWNAAILPDTKALLVESVSNPLSIVADIEALAAVAHKHGIILIVDNTLATPYLINPFEYGADVVVYSTTKAINGHGNAIGGVVLESGAFDYANGNYPQFERKEWFFKSRERVERSVLEIAPTTPFTSRLRGILVTLLGAAPSPFDSYLTLIGLETLKARLAQETASTERVVGFLEEQREAGRITAIYHPAAHDYPYHELADKYLTRGYDTVIAFDVDTEERKRRVLDALRLFSLQANLGDSKSLAIDPFVVTHPELTLDELRIAGITPSTIRLSIGLEETDDLIADLRQALDSAYAA